MKQSLINAKNEARNMSVKHPDTTYYVLDKPRGKAKVHSETIVNSPIFMYDIMKSGYFPYCRYRNGIELV